MLKIKWFGHSMWKITTGDVSIIIDPFTDIGYKVPQDQTADIVISSHDHFDHNNFEIIGGNPKIIREVGDFEYQGVKIKTFPVWHDENKGAERGSNLLSRITLEGKNLLHCGDLGHMLSESILGKLGKIDVIFIPVGGYYTINAKTAKKIVDYVEPKVVFPMHFKTKVLDFPIAEKEAYLDLIPEFKKIDSNVITLTDQYFDHQQTLIMNYE